MKRQSFTQEVSVPAKKAAKTGHWSMKLLQSMEDPNMIVESDSLTVTIKDAFPKAKHHYLILPKESLSSLRSLTAKHISLLEHMDECGQSLTKQLIDKNPNLEFRQGYHAVPSMSQLHMHVISQDFDSTCLKTKKHWNSFTSDFFIDSQQIIKMLKSQNKIELNQDKYDALLKSDLVCHKCTHRPKNMPALVQHIKTHLLS